jgi:hypothetical protein
MKSLFKWIAIVFIGLIVLGIIATIQEKTDDKEALERLNKQTQSIKNCVETLGNGVYKDQSLSWKLDNCNASK